MPGGVRVVEAFADEGVEVVGAHARPERLEAALERLACAAVLLARARGRVADGERHA